MQRAVKQGAVRFLLRDGNGYRQNLTSAAIIKLFLKTGNARRVLFLVDRIELEVQAEKAFKALLKNDFTCIIYKEQRDDWRKADIVVTTVQSLLFNDKFRRLCANRLRSCDIRRSAPFNWGQRPRGVRVFRRLQARTDGNTEGLFEASKKYCRSSRSSRGRTTDDVGYLSDVWLRQRRADIPLFVARWRARWRLDQPLRCRCPDGHHYSAPVGRRLQR